METIFFRTREDERKTDSRTKTHTQHWILPRILALRPTFLRLRWNGWSASIKTKHEAVGRAINSNYREPCGRRKKLSTLLIHLVALLVSVSWPRNRPKSIPIPSLLLPFPGRGQPPLFHFRADMKISIRRSCATNEEFPFPYSNM